MDQEVRESLKRLQDAQALLAYTEETMRLAEENANVGMAPWHWPKWWRNSRALDRRFKEFERMEREYEEKWECSA